MMDDEDIDDDDFNLESSDRDDPLEAENFSPVQYISRFFPTVDGLSGLDVFVGKLKAQQQQIDEDVRHAIRRQAACGRRARADLDDAKAAVRELMERIRAIKDKSAQSEALVNDVCHEIKPLDVAKRNLTLTVTALKRLVVLVEALEQLRAFTASRRYQEAAGLIHAVHELDGHFKDLKHLPRVAEVAERKAMIFGDLKTQLLEDFASLHDAPGNRTVGVEDAACCVDAFGAAVRDQVITHFSQQVLESYKDIFQPPNPESGLDNIERRYSWIKRVLNEYDNKYDEYFPKHWRVPCRVCVDFCHITRQHLVEILSISHHTVDPETMVLVLLKSIDFENYLAAIFPGEGVAGTPASPPRSQGTLGSNSFSTAGFGFRYPDVLGPKALAASKQLQQADEAARFAPRFRGLLSECFDAYLSFWVQHEEKQLLTALDEATVHGVDEIVVSTEDDNSDGLAPKLTLRSGPLVFNNMKVSMKKCCIFSTHQILFDVFQVFRKVLTRYMEKLVSHLPKQVSSPLDSAGVQAVCCVLGTADFCLETAPQLAEFMQEMIDQTFVERVTFSVEDEHFRNLMHRSYQDIVQSVNSSLDKAFAKMTRTDWAHFPQVGDNCSAYVGMMCEQLSEQFEPIAGYLSRSHYRFFCSKFLQAFVARYIGEFFRCRKINVQAALQLLIDAGDIKTMLLEVPVTATSGRQMQTVYSNFVLKEMGRAEAMLRVLSATDLVAANAIISELGSSRVFSGEFTVERLLGLRTDHDGDFGEPSASPRQDGDEGLGVAAFRSTIATIGDTFKQTHAKTSEDLKKLSGDVKKRLPGFIPGMN
eukprot:TRINITY_DN25630_c0_g1_i1.p1 TRINITY_DN25630_c0_g1~~TRINITY_DN25630_c0_g1_i1.p1  ORF type:complete len:816 (+),score=188.69 TRINITY_DN25630_c0_g1_i1:90-2537(+)